MSAKRNRDANRVLAEEQWKAGQVPFVELQRQSLRDDPWAWSRSGMPLLKAALLLIETATAGTTKHIELLEREGDGPMSPEAREALDDAHLWPVVQMLLGMAFECLLKCLIVEGGGSPPEGKNGHDLVMLVGKTSLSLSDKAKDLLAELTLMNQLGRYPVHASKDVMTTFELGLDMEAVLETVAAIAATRKPSEVA